MTVALKTSPHSSCLKELCLCYFIHKSVGRMAWGQLTQRWHRDLASLLAWEAADAADVQGRAAQCIILLWMPWNQGGVQHQRPVTAALGMASVRVRGCNVVMGKQRRLDEVRQQPALPPWMKQPPQGGAVPHVSTWTRRKCCFGATH